MSLQILIVYVELSKAFPIESYQSVDNSVISH